LADVYDALTTKRFYKEAYSHDKAKNMIIELKGKHFDPEVVNAFLAVQEKLNQVRKEKLKEESSLLRPPSARAVGR
jgi:HD-GYP domain-containing protein (c-di-GMP phosphodiesterase class II)